MMTLNADELEKQTRQILKTRGILNPTLEERAKIRLALQHIAHTKENLIEEMGAILDEESEFTYYTL